MEKRFYLPTWLYRLVPFLYMACGIFTLLTLQNLLGAVSGLLLLGAGILVLMWRGGEAAQRRRREAARQKRLQAKRRKSQQTSLRWE